MENVSQGGKTDMDFAKEIAIERGCSVWVENNTLVVMPYVLSESSVQLAYRKIYYLLGLHIMVDREKQKEKILQLLVLIPIVKN